MKIPGYLAFVFTCITNITANAAEPFSEPSARFYLSIPIGDNLEKRNNKLTFGIQTNYTKITAGRENNGVKAFSVKPLFDMKFNRDGLLGVQVLGVNAMKILHANNAGESSSDNTNKINWGAVVVVGLVITVIMLNRDVKNL